MHAFAKSAFNLGNLWSELIPSGVIHWDPQRESVRLDALEQVG